MISKSEITMSTYPCGLRVHHFDSKPEEFDIRDIAHHLSLLCRFMGGVPWMYSVAQHSIYVDDVLLRLDPKASPQVRMHALMHDATDAYWGDLHSQAKRKVSGYQKAYKTMEQVIWKKFQLSEKEPRIVKQADGVMLSTELVTLKGEMPHEQEPLNDFNIKRWTGAKAEKEFLLRYAKIRQLRIDSGDFVPCPGV